MDVETLRNRLGSAVVRKGGNMDAATRVLAQAEVGYLALSGFGWPYVVPISFAYSEDGIFFHGGGSLKAELIAADARACLAASIDTKMHRTQDDPCADGFLFESVLAFGEVGLLTTSEERETGLRSIVRKYDPEAEQRPFRRAVLQDTHVYRMAIVALTYKRRRPGA